MVIKRGLGGAICAVFLVYSRAITHKAMSLDAVLCNRSIISYGTCYIRYDRLCRTFWRCTHRLPYFHTVNYTIVQTGLRGRDNFMNTFLKSLPQTLRTKFMHACEYNIWGSQTMADLQKHFDLNSYMHVD